MSEPSANVSRTTEITTRFTASDGAELVGDLAVPASPRAGVILCHPHPQHGGTRHDMVISAAASALVASGVATLRFDFRNRFDDGVGERLDGLAALDELVLAVPDVPVAVVGYSFGAMIAMALDDPRLHAQVLIAPPLAAAPAARPPRVPTLVLVPAHDQFSPPARSAPIIDSWRAGSTVAVDSEVIESADHFLAGHTADVAARTVRWLTASW